MRRSTSGEGWKVSVTFYMYLLSAAMCVDTKICFITGRNEVVAKVMFLLVSVILLTGGGGSAHGPGGGLLMVPGEGMGRHPHPPPTKTPWQTSSPQQTPPWYGQWAASMHPTGMHSSMKYKTRPGRVDRQVLDFFPNLARNS